MGDVEAPNDTDAQAAQTEQETSELQKKSCCGHVWAYSEYFFILLFLFGLMFCAWGAAQALPIPSKVFAIIVAVSGAFSVFSVYGLPFKRNMLEETRNMILELIRLEANMNKYKSLNNKYAKENDRLKALNQNFASEVEDIKSVVSGLSDLSKAAGELVEAQNTIVKRNTTLKEQMDAKVDELWRTVLKVAETSIQQRIMEQFDYVLDKHSIRGDNAKMQTVDQMEELLQLVQTSFDNFGLDAQVIRNIWFKVNSTGDPCTKLECKNNFKPHLSARLNEIKPIWQRQMEIDGKLLEFQTKIKQWKADKFGASDEENDLELEKKGP